MYEALFIGIAAVFLNERLFNHKRHYSMIEERLCGITLNLLLPVVVQRTPSNDCSSTVA